MGVSYAAVASITLYVFRRAEGIEEEEGRRKWPFGAYESNLEASRSDALSGRGLSVCSGDGE